MIGWAVFLIFIGGASFAYGVMNFLDSGYGALEKALSYYRSSSIYKDESELQHLQRAYKDVLNTATKGFHEIVGGWLLSGAGALLGWYAMLNGEYLTTWSEELMEDVPDVKTTGYIVDIGFIIAGLAFIMMILSYLRVRSYERELLAIRLKDSKNAEISIKV
ncbi:MAG: hypothetical protein J7K48_03750 [Thermococcus sp.]|nr:hypothetical protein [Thermococcus sp.]